MGSIYSESADVLASAVPIDTSNKFAVAMVPGGVKICAPKYSVLSPDEALSLAAWLVACAECEASVGFPAVLRAISEEAIADEANAAEKTL